MAAISLWLVGFTLSMKAMLMAELSAAGKLEKYVLMEENPAGDAADDGVVVYYSVDQPLKRFIAGLALPAGVRAEAGRVIRPVIATLRSSYIEAIAPEICIGEVHSRKGRKGPKGRHGRHGRQCFANDGPEIVLKFLQSHPRARIVVVANASWDLSGAAERIADAL